MTIPSDFVNVLRCPATREKLEWAPSGDALLNASGTHRYPIVDGVLLLLPGSARDEKADVQQFYDAQGWQETPSGAFADAVMFEDLRPVAREYIAASHARVGRRLPQRGKYLLDVASGPVQYREYLAYSAGYERRICVDLSLTALRAARAKLGEHGIYVQGDITNLPFRDGSIDAAVSLHTIYHVPADEQQRAFAELARVVTPGGRAVIVYSWGQHAPIAIAMRFAGTIGSLLRGSRGRQPRPAPETELYFHPHPPRWLSSALRGLDYEVLSWRSLGVDMTKALARPGAFGRALLAAASSFEERFPRVAARLGQYPLIVLKP
jgi:SAM-dependent methyltransferase